MQAVSSVTIKIFQPAQMTTHLTRCILSLAHVGFYVLPSSVCFVIIIIGGSLLFLSDKEAPKKELRDFFYSLIVNHYYYTFLNYFFKFNIRNLFGWSYLDFKNLSSFQLFSGFF